MRTQHPEVVCESGNGADFRICWGYLRVFMDVMKPNRPAHKFLKKREKKKNANEKHKKSVFLV